MTYIFPEMIQIVQKPMFVAAFVVLTLAVLAVTVIRCRKELQTCHPEIRSSVVEAHVLIFIQFFMVGMPLIYAISGTVAHFLS
jgi:hypothetical protein